MIRKQGYRSFTDEQVRVIKANMVLGVSISTLARTWGCGEGTMSRMRRGLTYSHVRVEGEEELRPAIEVVGMTERGQQVMTGKTEEQLVAEEEESLKEVFRLAAAREAAPKVVEEVDRMILEQVAAYHGKAVPQSVREALGREPEDGE